MASGRGWMKLVQTAASIAAHAGRATARERAIHIVREATEGLDTQDIAYLVGRGKPIWEWLPRRFTDLTCPHCRQRFTFDLFIAGVRWLAPNADLMNLSAEERSEAAIAARPDCRELLETDAGREWLQGLFTWSKV